MNETKRQYAACNAATKALFDDSTPERQHLIAVTEPRSPAEQTALDAALFERARCEKLDLAIRRALIHLGRKDRFAAQLELQNALL
jgi:hypothetical protein